MQHSFKAGSKYGRFKTSIDEVLGKGASSVVRLGEDTERGIKAALKIYLLQEDQEAFELLDYVEHLIEVYKSLSSPFSFSVYKPKKKGESWRGEEEEAEGNLSFTVSPPAHFLELIETCNCVQIRKGLQKLTKIQLSSIKVGDDIGVFCALELAKFSLADYIEDRRRAGKLASVELIKSRLEGRREDKDFEEILLDILLALCCLEKANLVHLDLKPENVMYTFKGRWVLSDMDGCVDFTRPVDTNFNTCAFTALYAPPELARGLLDGPESMQVAPSMDIWSLALTLADLACPEHPFAQVFQDLTSCGGSPAFLAYLSDPKLKLPSLSWLADECGTEIVDFLHRCTFVKDPSRRKRASELIKHPFVHEPLWERAEIQQKERQSPGSLLVHSPHSSRAPSTGRLSDIASEEQSIDGHLTTPKTPKSPKSPSRARRQSAESDMQSLLFQGSILMKQVPSISFDATIAKVSQTLKKGGDLQASTSREPSRCAEGTRRVKCGTKGPMSFLRVYSRTPYTPSEACPDEEAFGWETAIRRRQSVLAEVLGVDVSEITSRPEPKKLAALHRPRLHSFQGEVITPSNILKRSNTSDGQARQEALLHSHPLPGMVVDLQAGLSLRYLNEIEGNSEEQSLAGVVPDVEGGREKKEQQCCCILM